MCLTAEIMMENMMNNIFGQYTFTFEYSSTKSLPALCKKKKNGSTLNLQNLISTSANYLNSKPFNLFNGNV